MSILVDNTKVSADGQIVLPRAVTQKLGLIAGDHVVFIQEENQVTVMNAALYAMKKIQAEMAGEAEKVNLQSEEDINNLLCEIRSEVEIVRSCPCTTEPNL